MDDQQVSRQKNTVKWVETYLARKIENERAIVTENAGSSWFSWSRLVVVLAQLPLASVNNSTSGPVVFLFSRPCCYLTQCRKHVWCGSLGTRKERGGEGGKKKKKKVWKCVECGGSDYWLRVRPHVRSLLSKPSCAESPKHTTLKYAWHQTLQVRKWKPCPTPRSAAAPSLFPAVHSSQ